MKEVLTCPAILSFIIFNVQRQTEAEGRNQAIEQSVIEMLGIKLRLTLDATAHY